MNIQEKIQPFFIGGLSGMTATSIIQPVDMIKVRIQIKNEQNANLLKEGKIQMKDMNVSPIKILQEVYEKGGIRMFYKGLDSALTRQIFYTTSRLGIYKTMFNYIKNKQKRELFMYEKAYCSMTAGFLGSIIGNPADLALIRMQNDTVLPKEQQRGYRNVYDALSKISKDEGVLGLWRGCTPTVVRAMALNLGMLAPYDEVKERLTNFNMSEQNKRLISSAVAGFLAAFLSLPFDNAKTKMQKMKLQIDGTYPYKNICHAVLKTTKNEGVLGLWVGFPTYYVRIAPHAMITLLMQDFLTALIRKRQQKF